MSEDVEKIESIIYGIFKSFSDHKPGDIASRTHKDYTVWDVFVPELMTDPDEIKAYRERDQEQSKARGKLTINIEKPRINVWGDYGLARYYLNFTYEPPFPVSGRVRITTVFLREDGVWKSVHHHEGFVPSGVPKYKD